MKKNFLLLLLLSMISFEASADIELPVSILTNQLHSSHALGEFNIESIGKVSFIARKTGNQLVVLAQNSKGVSIGKAETVIGSSETPIYLSSPQGLVKVNIRWGVKEK